MTNLLQIGITDKYYKWSGDRQLLFDEKETYLHHYLGILIVALPIATASIPKVLVDIGNSFNILYTNMLKWMRILLYFLQLYLNVVLGLNGALTKAKERIKRSSSTEWSPNQSKRKN